MLVVLSLMIVGLNMPDAPQQPQPAVFQPTQWTMVAEAGDPAHPQHEEALSRLLHLYRPALSSHLIRRRRLQPAEADDVLQEFIVRKILQYNLPAHADRARGKFRTLLLTALDNFVRTRCITDDPCAPLSESHDLSDDSLSPDESFDVPWARQVLHESMRRMQTECRQTGRLDIWDVFESRVIAPALEGAVPVDYQTLVTRHNFESPMQASNALMTGKRIFERTLRSVISEYAQEDEIEIEIIELRQILARASVA
jgi:DNA-directed RNA polymerase specialized sigma24 family protein